MQYRAKKYLGQNFLIDRNIQKKIIRACEIAPGDIVFGDDDGIVVMTEEGLKDIVEAALAVQKVEEQIFARMKQGQSLLEMLNFSEHFEKISRHQPSQLTFKI